MPAYRLEHLTFGGAFLLTLNATRLMRCAAFCNLSTGTSASVEIPCCHKGVSGPVAYRALGALDGLQQKALRIRNKIAFCVVKLNDAKSGRRPLTTPQAGRVGEGFGR